MDKQTATRLLDLHTAGIAMNPGGWRAPRTSKKHRLACGQPPIPLIERLALIVYDAKAEPETSSALQAESFHRMNKALAVERRKSKKGVPRAADTYRSARRSAVPHDKWIGVQAKYAPQAASGKTYKDSGYPGSVRRANARMQLAEAA